MLLLLLLWAKELLARSLRVAVRRGDLEGLQEALCIFDASCNTATRVLKPQTDGF